MLLPWTSITRIKRCPKTTVFFQRWTPWMGVDKLAGTYLSQGQALRCPHGWSRISNSLRAGLHYSGEGLRSVKNAWPRHGYMRQMVDVPEKNWRQYNISYWVGLLQPLEAGEAQLQKVLPRSQPCHFIIHEKSSPPLFPSPSVNTHRSRVAFSTNHNWETPFFSWPVNFSTVV